MKLYNRSVATVFIYFVEIAHDCSTDNITFSIFKITFCISYKIDTSQKLETRIKNVYGNSIKSIVNKQTILHFSFFLCTL